MAKVATIPRSRGSVSGLALIVLGAWGGIAAYAGPRSGYGFTPRAWEYTEPRLFLSALPGAVALVAGLVIMLTRRRGLGGGFAVIAALAGAWFEVGRLVAPLLPAGEQGPLAVGPPPAGATLRQVALTNIALFWGVGALIVFFAALALGRFSIAAAKDSQQLSTFLAGAASGAAGTGAVAGAGYQADAAATAPQYPAAQFPSYPPDRYAQYPAEQYPAEQQSTAAQPGPAEWYPPSISPSQGADADPARTRTGEFPPSPPFPPGASGGQPG